MDTVKIKCLEIEQPIGKFYVGKISWQDLLDISYSDIRRIEKEEKGTIEAYLGIQRNLSESRLKEIAEYVSFSDSTFPSSIVLSVKSYNYENDISIIQNYNEKTGELELLRDDKVAQIIDGQHRVFGIKKYIDKNPLFATEFKFDLIITIFIDIDPEKESMIFSTINKAQTKVNKSLVYDLYDLAKSRSPQRTAHNIVKLLNEMETSPFHRKIKRLGIANDPERETITQSTFVECILAYISKKGEEMKDRDILIRGKKLSLISGRELERRIFRNWFIQGKEAEIAKVIWNYFTAVKDRWPEAWNNNSILVKSTGLIAFMKFLGPVMNKLGIETIPKTDQFYEIINKVQLKDEDFNTKQFIPGAKGQSDLFKKLVSDTQINA